MPAGLIFHRPKSFMIPSFFQNMLSLLKKNFPKRSWVARKLFQWVSLLCANLLTATERFYFSL